MCTLKIIPPHRAKSLKLKFHREQIVSTKHIFVTSDGDYVDESNSNSDSNNTNNNDEKKQTYDSYAIILHQDGIEMAKLRLEEKAIEEEEYQNYQKRKRQQHISASSDNNNHDADLIQEMTEQGVLSQEQKEYIMENFGSEARTDPKLLQQFEEQKKTFIEKKNRENIGVHDSFGETAKERQSRIRMVEIQEQKRKLVEGLKLPARKGKHRFPRLDELHKWSEVGKDDGQYFVIMRKYSIGHRKRRVTSLMRSINNYMDNKRQRIILRENRNVSWKGVVGLVLGIFSFLLSILIGQFWNESNGLGSRKKIRTSTGNANYANSVRRKHVNHLNAQGPPLVSKHFPSRKNTSGNKGPMKPKAYGGYVAK
jgi:hypothetical protein